MESVMKRTTASGLLATCAISFALFSSCNQCRAQYAYTRRNRRRLATPLRRKNIERLERLQRNNSDATLACG